MDLFLLCTVLQIFAPPLFGTCPLLFCNAHFQPAGARECARLGGVSKPFTPRPPGAYVRTYL